MSVKIAYFVHGTTIDNEAHRATGQNQGVLSEVGRRQSCELGKRINLDEIDVVFCSDLQRAIDSAGLIFEDKKDIIQDSRIRECNYGKLNGMDSSLIVYEEHIDLVIPVKFQGLETMSEEQLEDFRYYKTERIKYENGYKETSSPISKEEFLEGVRCQRENL